MNQVYESRKRGVGTGSRLPLPVFLIVFALTATSCSNRATECNRLVEVANRAADQVRSVTPKTTPQDAQTLTKIATAFDRAAQQLRGIELSDRQLQSYKSRYVAMYVTASKASRALLIAKSQQSDPAAQQALATLQSAMAPEDALVTEVNDYCATN